jgi:hemerythrin superfamily protein
MTFQQQLHHVSDVFARAHYLKNKNIEITRSALQNVNKNNKEFKTLFRDIKKTITDHNTPMHTMSVDLLLKMPHI